MARYGADMCMCTRMSPALADDLGDQVYMVRLREEPEIEAFFSFLTE